MVLLFFGCSSSEESPPPTPARGAIELGPPVSTCAITDDTTDLEKHACLHAEKGPFANASASAEPSAPSISKTHTAYTVTVPGDAQWVAYRAKDEGMYAFYSSPKVRLAVRGGSGQQLPLACEGPTTGACEALPYVVHARLAANEDIRVALYPAAAGEPFRLVIEDLD